MYVLLFLCFLHTDIRHWSSSIYQEYNFLAWGTFLARGMPAKALASTDQLPPQSFWILRIHRVMPWGISCHVVSGAVFCRMRHKA